MPESELHRFYVSQIVKYIEETYCADDERLIVTDLIDESVRPPRIDNYVPDVFYNSQITGDTVIGEAKSCGDISANRSIKQIQAFIKYCNDVNAILIIAVPWDEYSTAINIVRNFCRRMNISIQFKILMFLPRDIL